MSRILRHRPSPAMVVAFMALCVALAGTASALPGRNAVEADDIARNAVRTSDIARNAIRNRHIRARSVTRSKIAKRPIDSSLGRHRTRCWARTSSSRRSARCPTPTSWTARTHRSSRRAPSSTRFTLGERRRRSSSSSTAPLTLTARCTISAGGDTAEVADRHDAGQRGLRRCDSDRTSTAATPRPAASRGSDCGERNAAVRSRRRRIRARTGRDRARTASLFAGVNVLGQAGRCVFGGWSSQS